METFVHICLMHIAKVHMTHHVPSTMFVTMHYKATIPYRKLQTFRGGGACTNQVSFKLSYFTAYLSLKL